ncbi:hypothetical protein LIER_25991 [Lithospermum erythrorhizon]|uniref:Uncharacterized protein n=1 Tax=Lithospermum erythrorhizon TaxID=34254 RepID=A0AAV3R9V7_LITER
MKANAQDGAGSSVPSKLQNLDHAPAPESQPEDSFADMAPLEEIGLDEEETTVVERNTFVNSQEVETPGPRRTEKVTMGAHDDAKEVLGGNLCRDLHHVYRSR